MRENYQIDSTDLALISHLQRDARTPFLELARRLGVSGGTIHQRFDRLKELGIVKGSQLKVDIKKLGVGVTVLLGVHTVEAKDVKSVIEKLRTFREVTEILYTTGSFGLFVRAHLKDIDHLHQFLIKRVQNISEVRSTETFICLDIPLERSLKLELP